MAVLQKHLTREVLNDFDLRDRRLMLSLGPLSPKKYCSFSCPFCYLHSNDFPSYISMPVSGIINWICKQTEPFDIVYVSGDTDSFAPPRTAQGIQLLEELTKFKVDILFTTRSLFDNLHLELLAHIQQIQSRNKKMLIGCVSISQLHHPRIEPKPIPSPEQRIEQLRRFKSMNIVSVLALRPFLPIVPLEEYIEIVTYAKDFVDVVLGSNWFADQDGILESKIFRDEKSNKFVVNNEKMDFYNSNATWRVYKSETIEKEVKKYCDSNNLPFFMRSTPAIRWLQTEWHNPSAE